MYCKRCGKQLDDNWVVCPYCNEIISHKTSNQSETIKENMSEKSENIDSANEIENDIRADNIQKQFTGRESKKPKKNKSGVSSVIVCIVAIIIVFFLFRFVKNNYTSTLPNSAKNAPSSSTVYPNNGVEETSNPNDEYEEGVNEQKKSIDSSGSEGDKPEESSLGETETHTPVVENGNSPETYLREIINYDGWSIFTNYAYRASTYVDSFYVKIDCTINNTTDSIKTFTTSEFSLNNNGIIKESVGMGDYEYTEIAPSGSFNTTIEFLFPNNSNKILDNMTMIIGDVSVCLGYRPQPEEYRDDFFGVYVGGKGTVAEKAMWVSPSDREGMYYITTYLYSEALEQLLISDEEDITLDENNVFKFNGLYYRWFPEEYSINQIVSESLINDIQENTKTLVKQ